MKIQEVRKLQLSKSNNWLKLHHIPMNRKHKPDIKDLLIKIELLGEALSMGVRYGINQTIEAIGNYSKAVQELMKSTQQEAEEKDI